MKKFMLTNEQIANHLLSDVYSYKEYIQEMIVGRLMDSSRQRTYWDAWFRGARGRDLELADEGVPFVGEVYYQPILSDEEWDKNRQLNSFDVYRSYARCKFDFPNNEIGAYSGDDIEEPNYID